MANGYVYALKSNNCPYLKIGRTNTLPNRRLRELNSHEHYGALGPWEIVTYLEVTDDIAVETFLHRSLREKRRDAFRPCSELFEISPATALEKFDAIPKAQVRGFDKVARLYNTDNLYEFLRALFRATGLENFKSAQGAWTFSLFPSTSGGRYFTINIDRHEVAYALLPKGGKPATFCFVMDSLVWSYKDFKRWIKAHNGREIDSKYASGLERQSNVVFDGDLADALEFLKVAGVRRALLAYWYDLLLNAIDSSKTSLHQRFHNLAAVEAILAHAPDPRGGA